MQELLPFGEYVPPEQNSISTPALLGLEPWDVDRLLQRLALQNGSAGGRRGRPRSRSRPFSMPGAQQQGIYSRSWPIEELAHFAKAPRVVPTCAAFGCLSERIWCHALVAHYSDTLFCRQAVQEMVTAKLQVCHQARGKGTMPALLPTCQVESFHLAGPLQDQADR